MIDRTRSGNLAFLVTEFGKPFTAGGFGSWFRKRRNEIGAGAEYRPDESNHGRERRSAFADAAF